MLRLDNALVFEKIKSGFMISPKWNINLTKNCRLLHENAFGESDDDINRLTLVNIDKNDYGTFKKRLFDKLKTICKMK